MSMKITKRDPFTGKENTVSLDITEQQYMAWCQGMLIQNAMPNLSLDEREFLISGMAPDTFDEMFAEV